MMHMSVNTLSIDTDQLSHRFGKDAPVVDGVNLQVPTGSIYGFLGPNGAGKTTTMRLLLGLLRKQQGRIQLLNRSLETDRVAIMQKVGTMIESPSVYAHLHARENLRILQHIYQCKASRIEEVLRITGLSDTGKKPAGKFSLGMKQRLGIAMALLHEPELLILDEPTNGLDPNGMIEVRELLRTLHSEHGLTIFVSSHLLAEVEKLATHTGIIHKGRLRFQGSMQELREAQQAQSTTRVHTDNIEQSKALLAQLQLPYRIEQNHLVMSGLNTEQRIQLNKHLVTSGIGVAELCSDKNDLENLFMNLIQN